MGPARPQQHGGGRAGAAEQGQGRRQEEEGEVRQARAFFGARLESGLCHDQLSCKHFLVDTGATYSVFLHRSSAPASGPVLTGPVGRPIATWGEMEIPLLFDVQHFTWNFLSAAVQLPILGMDFLQQQGLLVDVGKHQLIMMASMKIIRAVAPSGGPGGLYTAVASSSTGYGPLFTEYGHPSLLGT